MKAFRLAVIALILISANSAFAARGKENCQAQAQGTREEDRRVKAANAIRVFEGNAKPATPKSTSEGKAIPEKGS